MLVRSSLSSFPTMREAYASVVALEALYLKTNKRKPSIDLTLASTSTPVYDERGRLKLSNETIEVRAVYDAKVAAQVTEYEWFAGAARAAGGKA